MNLYDLTLFTLWMKEGSLKMNDYSSRRNEDAALKAESNYQGDSTPYELDCTPDVTLYCITWPEGGKAAVWESGKAQSLGPSLLNGLSLNL